MNKQAMLDCILDEPEIVREIIEHKDLYTRAFVQHFKTHNVKRIYILGHGSPYNVGGVLRFMLERLLHTEVSVEYASLFHHHLSFNANGLYKSDEMLVICPAQSGKTRGPVDAVKKARRLGIPTMCTTLLRNGILAQNCDIIIEKRSGIEESFPETKGHIASLIIMMLNVLEIAHELHTIDDAQYCNYMEQIHQLPSHMERIIEITADWYKKHKEPLLKAQDITFIGYGENYTTAVEGSLKILETTLKSCLSYECEEFMHGQNQPVGKDSFIFMIANAGNEQHRVHRLAAWCREKGAQVIVLGDLKNETLTKDDLALPVVSCPYVSAIEYLIPFQVLSYYMAEDMGLSSVVAHHDDAGKELGVRYE